MKTLISILLSLVFIQLGFAQYTQVPDTNFEQALIDLGIDSEGILDGQFLTADAENVAFLYVDNYNISDLTGIEAFVNLEWLDASDNNISSIDLNLINSPVLWTLFLSNNELTTIDLSPLNFIVNLGLGSNNIQNLVVSNHNHLFGLWVSNQVITDLTISNCPNLQVLSFKNTLIQDIDLSQCPSLRNVYCYESQIQSLDFSNNPNLEEVRANHTPLTSINLPNNTNLDYLAVGSTQLTELNITQCPAILYLQCGSNSLTNLDLSNNTLLEDFQCFDNQLTALDLSNNPNLYRVWCKDNNISGDFDLTNNSILEYLSCRNNQFTFINLSNSNIIVQADASDNPNLEMVNIKNGGNDNMISFSAYNCPNLTCVVVDDPNAANDNISVGSAVLVGSVEECEGIYIDESVLESQINLYPNPVQDFIYIDNNSMAVIEKVIIYNSMGKSVLHEQCSIPQVNVSHLKSGIYMLQIITNKGMLSKKIMKE